MHSHSALVIRFLLITKMTKLQEMLHTSSTCSVWRAPLGFPGGSDSKESSYNAGDPGSIPELARYPEGDMETHSRIPGWRTPWTEEPGGLQSTGSHRVRHSWVTFNSLHFRSLSSVLWSTALVSKLPKWFRPPSPVWQLLPSSKKQKKSQRTKNSYEMERL